VATKSVFQLRLRGGTLLETESHADTFEDFLLAHQKGRFIEFLGKEVKAAAKVKLWGVPLDAVDCISRG